MAIAQIKSSEVVVADTMISQLKAMKCLGYSVLIIVVCIILLGLYSIGHPPTREIKTGTIIVGSLLAVISTWSYILLGIRTFKLHNLFKTTNVGEIIGICALYHGITCRCTVVRLPHFAAEVFLSEEQRDALCKAIKQYAKHGVEVSFAN